MAEDDLKRRVRRSDLSGDVAGPAGRNEGSMLDVASGRSSIEKGQNPAGAGRPQVRRHPRLRRFEVAAVLGGFVLLGAPSPVLAGAPEVNPVLGTETIADLAARTAPAVVNIDTIERQSDPTRPVNPFFHHFFGNGRKPGEFEAKGVGSGFVVSSSGLILTNWHVVQDAQRILVTFPNGSRYRGIVVGVDQATDLALIHVDAHGLAALPIAPDDAVRVGDWVVAIGSPLGLSTSVTAGIVSALGRDLPINLRIAFIQTDAPINPGNSGGPLLDLRGEVVGINTAIARNTTGIGFAIPSNTIRQILPQLIAKGHVDRPWLGVLIAEADVGDFGMPGAGGGGGPAPDRSGVLVRGVEPHSPAAGAGLEPGDRILAIDGRTMREPGELLRALSACQVGERVLVSVEHKGARSVIAIRLGLMPSLVDQTGAEDSGPPEMLDSQPGKSG